MTTVPRRTQCRPVVLDAACVVIIAFVSALPYLPHLGLYSDDWGVLAGLETADRSGSLLGYMIHGFPGRPVQGAYLALLYKLFGFGSLGSQMVNTAVIGGSAALLYGLLVRLRIARGHAFAVAVMFLMLPQLSTVRVWFSAFQVPLSMAFALLSLHAQLSFAQSRNGWWLAVSLLAAAFSIASYEIFAPIIAGFVLVLAVQHRPKLSGSSTKPPTSVRVGTIVLMAVVAAGVLYKIAVSGRVSGLVDPDRYLQGLCQLVRPDYDWRLDSGLNLFAAFDAYFAAPVRGWTTGAAAALRESPGSFVIALAAGIAAITWWRLRSSDLAEDESGSLKRLALWGAGSFVLGHATFLLVPAIVFTPTGIGTRVQVAAAMGAAMIFVALLAFALRATPARSRPAVFSLAVSIVIAAAFIRLQTIERYWAEAPLLQQRVLDAAGADLRHLPVESTVLLDGVCPYHGPAVVFETSWDVGPALSRLLGRPINGDAVSPRLSITPTGIVTSIYEEPTHYSYAPGLFVYDVRDRRLVPLPDAQAASQYFTGREPIRCPQGYVGRGVDV